jgi:hypothetical protein
MIEKGTFANVTHKISSGALCSLLSLATKKTARQIALCIMSSGGRILCGQPETRRQDDENRLAGGIFIQETFKNFKIFRTRTSARL